VEVYAICARHFIELENPKFCPLCAEEED
jgi:hypothetical protein